MQANNAPLKLRARRKVATCRNRGQWDVIEALESRAYLSLVAPVSPLVSGTTPALVAPVISQTSAIEQPEDTNPFPYGMPDPYKPPVFVDTSGAGGAVATSATWDTGGGQQAFVFAVLTYAPATFTEQGTPGNGDVGFQAFSQSTDDVNGGEFVFDGNKAATPGVFPFSVTATNYNGSTTQAFTITILQSPLITSSFNGAVTFGQNFTITTNGPPTSSIGFMNLPDGVIGTDNGDGTATLSLDPNATVSPGTSDVTVTASNGNPPDAMQILSLTVTPGQAPMITSPNSGQLKVQLSGSTPIVITTTAVPTAGIFVGSLPDGVAFTDRGDGTGTLNLTGDGATPGNYPLTIVAVNGVQPNATQAFTLTIAAVAPMITSPDTATLTPTTPFRITTIGDPIAIVSNPRLPHGVRFAYTLDFSVATLTLVDEKPGSGNYIKPGTYTVLLHAKNGAKPDAMQKLRLTIAGDRPKFTSAPETTFMTAPPGGISTLQDFTITTSGTLPATILVLDSPQNLDITGTDNGDGTATLGGFPTPLPRFRNDLDGVYEIEILAYNDFGVARQRFKLTIDEPPYYIGGTAITLVAGKPTFMHAVTVLGYPKPEFTQIDESGLPEGLRTEDTGLSNTITLLGVPKMAGTGSLLTSASNGIAPDAQQTLLVTIDPATSEEKRLKKSMRRIERG